MRGFVRRYVCVFGREGKGGRREKGVGWRGCFGFRAKLVLWECGDHKLAQASVDVWNGRAARGGVTERRDKKGGQGGRRNSDPQFSDGARESNSVSDPVGDF